MRLWQLNCFGQNAFGVIQRFADRAIYMIAATDSFTADRAYRRFWRFAQSPKLFCVVAQAGLTPRDQQLVFGWCIEDLYGDHMVIINQIPAAQAVCHNVLQFLSFKYNKEAAPKSSSFGGQIERVAIRQASMTLFFHTLKYRAPQRMPLFARLQIERGV
jgi:hypothetical protein